MHFKFLTPANLPCVNKITSGTMFKCYCRVITVPAWKNAVSQRLYCFSARVPDWNKRNEMTKVLPKVKTPKEVGIEIYESAKKHYEEFTGLPKIEAAQEEVYKIQVGIRGSHMKIILMKSTFF